DDRAGELRCPGRRDRAGGWRRRPLTNAQGDYGENGCTGGPEKRRTNGEDQEFTSPIEDQLSSPFNLRCSVSPVNPCPPRPPYPRARVLRILEPEPRAPSPESRTPPDRSPPKNLRTIVHASVYCAGRDQRPS